MKTYITKGIFIILLAFGLVACNNDESQEQQNAKYIKVKNSDLETEQGENLSNTEMAEHLAHIASSIPGVKHATAVVLGPYSVVGIDVDAELDRTRVGTIKYSVAEAIKQDTNGSNTMVVADGDVTERIRRMSLKIRQGHPEDAILDELSEIVGRYMPEV